MELERFGAFLRARRTELGLTQAELAEKLNVTDKAVSRWERGKGYPEVTLLEPLARALDLSLVELMQSRRIEGSLTKEEADAAAAGVLEISRQPKEKQRPRWFPAAAGAAVFAAVGALGIFLAGLLTVPTWMLTRWNPDLTVNDGFADWYAVLDQSWTSMEHTAYEDGKAVSTTRFWNGLDGAHRISRTDAQGRTTYLEGNGSFGHSTTDTHDSFYEHLLPAQADSWIGRLFTKKNWDTYFLSGRYLVSNDRMVSFQVTGKGGTPVKQVELEHNMDSVGQELLCQRLLDSSGNILGYQRYGWNQYSQCTQVCTYDAMDNLVEQTVITFRDRVGYGVTQTPEGEVLQTSKSWFTMTGNLKRREIRNGQGQLTGTEEYRHRFWERFFSTTGMGILFAVWGVSGFLGIDTYLQLKKNREEEKIQDTQPAQPSSALGETQAESPMLPRPDANFDVWPYKVFCILSVVFCALAFLEAGLTWEQDTYLNYRAAFWLDIARSMGLALLITVPAAWIRKRKKQG